MCYINSLIEMDGHGPNGPKLPKNHIVYTTIYSTICTTICPSYFIIMTR